MQHVVQMWTSEVNRLFRRDDHQYSCDHLIFCRAGKRKRPWQEACAKQAPAEQREPQAASTDAQHQALRMQLQAAAAEIARLEAELNLQRTLRGAQQAPLPLLPSPTSPPPQQLPPAVHRAAVALLQQRHDAGAAAGFPTADVSSPASTDNPTSASPSGSPTSLRASAHNPPMQLPPSLQHVAAALQQQHLRGVAQSQAAKPLSADLNTVTVAVIDRAAGSATTGSTDDPEEECRSADVDCGRGEDGETSGSNTSGGSGGSKYGESSLAEALRESASLVATEAADRTSDASQDSRCLSVQPPEQASRAPAKQHDPSEEVRRPQVRSPVQQAAILSDSARSSAQHRASPTGLVESLELRLDGERRRVGELQRCLTAVHAASADAKAAAAEAAQQAAEHVDRLAAANEVCDTLPFAPF